MFFRQNKNQIFIFGQNFLLESTGSNYNFFFILQLKIFFSIKFETELYKKIYRPSPKKLYGCCLTMDKSHFWTDKMQTLLHIHKYVPFFIDVNIKST